jgi:hypothetical protein
LTVLETSTSSASASAAPDERDPQRGDHLFAAAEIPHAAEPWLREREFHE